MKRFMTTTAIALFLGTSAMAEGHMAMFSTAPFNAAINLNASDIIGARVYATEASLEGTTSVTADQATAWDDIGEINEIILTRDGTVQSVIVGVGGFLGIGEKDVAVNMGDLRFVSDGDDPEDYFLVINANAEGIMEAAAYERADMDHDNDQTRVMAPMIERDGYRTVVINDLTTEDLTGARVYGLGDEDVGEISQLLMTTDGTIDRAVIDVGGFLGMGERPVAVSFDELTIIRADDGGDLRVYIDSSEEALEAKPEYEG
ncbi:PRC-barrel domain-containing protein [Pararhodobacter sp.]|uniref:PRC-barrel domain-containing protein n=1 Tax=Pararhodobacter sp. TaxID=2127056 RepID=UPI002AFF57F3|nr:PRC-barrel domain-containing protein [Pararhodobacter sp.]